MNYETWLSILGVLLFLCVVIIVNLKSQVIKRRDSFYRWFDKAKKLEHETLDLSWKVMELEQEIKQLNEEIKVLKDEKN